MGGRLGPIAGVCTLVVALALAAWAYGAVGERGKHGSKAEQPKVGDRPSMRPSRAIDVAWRKPRREGSSAKLPGGVSRATLESIAECESGGDSTAVSADGTYRGKYQFDTGTWASVGGDGDPAAAPEAEQNRRAALLYARTGASAWPVCS